MPQVCLLRSLPEGSRDIAGRKATKTDQVVAIASSFGRDYFDGSRAYGYGGYRYDGRWQPVARDIVTHFGLWAGDRVLDVGCAKGFLVKDMVDVGLDAYGLDVSRYAVIEACHPDVIGRLHRANALALPFADGAFAAAVAINVLHNLDRAGCVRALRELQRVSRGVAFVQVDAYRNADEKARFVDWVLTAKTHGTPEFWFGLFDEAGYTGDYDWTIA